MSTVKQTWIVEGITREAYVCKPTGNGLPILFAFHGHGGTGSGFKSKNFEASWTNCIVVYPTGLRTISPGDPTGNSTGWQHSVGEVNFLTGITDQDLKFFDAMLASFTTADPKMVFVHGWSNGGEFLYDVLWTARGNMLKAIAPASAILNTTAGKNPLPLFHTAGKTDPVVPFTQQQNCVTDVMILDQSDPSGSVWATAGYGTLATQWQSYISCPVVFTQYDNGHSYPGAIPALITKFFKSIL